jgi:hypothetical protein
MGKKPALTVVSGALATIIEPPATLGPAGAKLWRSIMVQYDIQDAGGLAILEDACAARDSATGSAEIIAAEGRMIRMKSGGWRDHPLIKHEIAARALTAKLLGKLGLDVEPVRAGAGRPGRGIGIGWEGVQHADETSND